MSWRWALLNLLVVGVLAGLAPLVSTAPPVSSLAALMLGLTGLQLLGLGIIGEYLGRVFEETKRRPNFIVSDAIDEGRAPRETFYDGYVVNAIMDAAFRWLMWFNASQVVLMILGLLPLRLWRSFRVPAPSQPASQPAPAGDEPVP